MLKKTHVSIGIATALAVIRPTTVASCLLAIIGGAIGGWLPDIDLNTKKKINRSDDSDEDHTDYIKDGIYYDPENYGEYGNDHSGILHNNEKAQTAIQCTLLIGLILILDLYFGNGISDYFSKNFSYKNIIGLVVLILLIIFGIHTVHRTFTHSLIGCGLFCLSVWLMAEPLGLAFICGFVSHIIIDILNKKPGNQYFWPFRPRIYMDLADADGRCNTILGNLGVIISALLFSYFFVPCLVTNQRMTEIMAFLNGPAFTLGNIPISGLAVYLIAINILSFLAFSLEQHIYQHTFTWQYSDDDSAAVLTTFHILAYAGGGLGMLIQVLIATKTHISKSKDSGNTTLYLVPAVSIVFWTILSLMIINPLNIDPKGILSNTVIYGLTIYHLLLIYFVIINLITFLLIMFFSRKSNTFTAVEISTFILAFLGGAVGVYIAMGISNRKMSVHHFTFGMPLLIIMHTLVIALILNIS